MSQLTDEEKLKGNRVLQLRLHLGLNQTEFGQKLSRSGKPVSQNYISAIEQGRKKLGDDVQSRIEARFNVKTRWLDHGLGEMLQEGGSEPTTEQELRLKSALKNIPSIKLRGGNLVWVSARDRGAFLRSGESPSLPRTPFPPIRENIFAFEVADSSMLPNYPPSSWVLVSRLDNPQDMVGNVVYGIQTSDQFMLAQFISRDEQGYTFGFTGGPPPVQLPKEAILHVYYIEFKLARP